MKLKKKGLFGEPMIILMAFILIIIIIVMFYIFTDFNKKNAFTIEKAKEELGNNIFMVGLLRTQTEFEGKQIELFELVSRYSIEGRKDEQTIIQNNITTLMKKMYNNKDICWTLTVPNQEKITSVKDCTQLSVAEKISASVIIPGLNRQAYEVKFETTR